MILSSQVLPEPSEAALDFIVKTQKNNITCLLNINMSMCSLSTVQHVVEMSTGQKMDRWWDVFGFVCSCNEVRLNTLSVWRVGSFCDARWLTRTHTHVYQWLHVLSFCFFQCFSHSVCLLFFSPCSSRKRALKSRGAVRISEVFEEVRSQTEWKQCISTIHHIISSCTYDSFISW